MHRADDHHSDKASQPALPRQSSPHVPGEEGVWVVIFGDLLVFGLFFVTLCYYRAADTALFTRSQMTLDQTLGLINTLLLLTSSWFVATFTERTKAGLPDSRRFVLAAMACGGGFIAIKALEYSQKIASGITLTTNEFFTFYFMYTGIHLIHVIIGLGVLSYLYRVAGRQVIGVDDIRMIEGGASFWHLVDILWVILFALFYVMR